MAPSGKNATAASKDRHKSNNNNSVAASSATGSGTGTGPNKHIVVLRVASASLRAIVDPASAVKEETPVKDDKRKDSPVPSTTLIAAPNSNNNTENASDSTPNTPAAGTPAPPATSMGPPTEGPKKKGAKRAAGAMNGDPKVRGKPGPKKKQRLDDGTVEGGRANGLGTHKLGPKANQGAINAGLRALDRSGKPCRKWNKGNFTLKSFTGVIWEIPRWTAPPKAKPEVATEESASASAEGSSKENKESNSQIKSETSNNGGDVEMQSATSLPAANSPAPVAIAAA